MEYLLPFILVLVILLAWALVGHGIWVFCAWLFRALGGSSGTAGSRPTERHCPRCGLFFDGTACAVCRWPWSADVAGPRPKEALDAISAQIKRFGRLGILDEAACARLENMLADERRQIDIAPTVEPAPAPAAPEPETIITATLVSEPAPPPIEPSPVEPPPVEREFAGGRTVEQPTIEQRAAAFAAHAQQPDTDKPTSEPPIAPARAWTDWLAAFMEERNIRWGELVGGLLIVCGSIALVVSFWSAIEQRPWLEFLLFNGVTAALFGVGFYSEHRWRLRTTSQGLLTIGGLLVPLNFLAIAALSSAPGSDGILTIAGELFSAGLFAALVYYAGRILVSREAIALTLGLLVPSMAQLLVRRFVNPSATTAVLVATAAVPVGCYLAVNFWTLRRAARTAIDELHVNALFKFLGMTSFAVVLPIALLLYRTGHPIEALRDLPGLVGLLGLVPLCAGLLLWEKLAGRAELAGLRTAGMSVAVGGALVSLASLVLAWPEPAAMLPAALVEFAVFTFVAWRFGLPAAHLVAAPCLTLAYLLGAHLVGGRIDFSGNGARRLAEELVSGRSGVLLAPLVLVYAGAAFFAYLRGFRARLPLGGAAAGLAAVSVGLVSWFGFGQEGDPLGAAWVYLLYAVALLAVAARQRRSVFAWLGCALLLAAVVQEIVYSYGGVLGLVRPEVTAILVFCTLSAAIAAGVRALDAAIDDSPLADVCWYASYFVSLAAAAWLVWLVPAQMAAFEAIHWAWIAVVWFAAALAIGWLPVWTMFQLALVLATLFGVWAHLQGRAWFAESPGPWLDPWTLQFAGVALVVLNLLWAAARIVCRRLAGRDEPSRHSIQAQELFASPWLSIDRVTTAALVVLLVLVGTFAAFPGVLQEIAPRGTTVELIEDFARLGIPYRHAGDWGSWALLAGLLILLAAVLRDRMSTSWLACLFVTAAVGAPLVASRFEAQTSVASALRWSSAVFLLVGSVAIWSRGPIARLSARLGWQPLAGDRRTLIDMTALVFTSALLAPSAIVATIGMQALSRAGQLTAPPNELFGLVIVLFVLVALAATPTSNSWRKWIGRTDSPGASLPWVAPAGALVLGATPLVALLVYHVALALQASPIVGPDADSIFHRVGSAVSYAVPIGLIGLSLVGYALRQRSSRFGLAGGLAFNLTASVAYLLTLSANGLTFDVAAWLHLAQLNAATAAIYTLAWAGLNFLDRRGGRSDQPLALDFPLSTQMMLAPAITALALGWAWVRLVQFPQGFPQPALPVAPELADLWGWLSFAVVCASVCAVAAAAGRRLGMLSASALLVALAILSAGVAARWDTGNWLAFNTLFVGHGAIGLGLLAVAWTFHRSPRADVSEDSADTPATARAGALWVVLQAAAIVALAFRELPANEWWSVGGFALVAVVLAPALAWIYQRRRYLYVAVPLLNLAATLALSKLNWIPDNRDFFYWNVILLALPAPAWLLIELRGIRPRRFQTLFEAPPAHRLVARLGTAALAFSVGASLLADWSGNPQSLPWMGLDWFALIATLVAAIACLWDVKGRDSVALIYDLGLVACAMLLDGFNLTPDWLLWTGTMLLAAYAVLTSYLWSRRRGLASIAAALGVPRPPQTELAALAWLVPANVVLACLVVLLTFFVEMTNRELAQRLLASQATLAQVVSLALLARGDRRGVLQLGALTLGAVGAVLFGWAWLEVDTSLTVLNALVVVAAATAGVAGLYGLGLGKLLGDTSDWLAGARRLTPVLAATSAAVIAATLGIEIFQFARFGEVRIDLLAILVVALTLSALAAAALAAAVLPGRDPLSLSQRGRTGYVYGAEILLALLFVHLRVTMPWLFTGFFQQFWPLIVMTIAYLGVGVAELFRRRQQMVLAEPLQNTGALLPVLPVLGYWASGSNVDYSLLLLCVGVLYAGLSIARRSFGFGVLAALAANGGLWFFLGRQDGWGFLTHPQVWLIPPALCILAAAYLNRRQLSESQMTGIRYFTSMAIYVSSTADIFITGVAHAPWLPLVLAGFSIAGILGGILLRVRAFLFLGTSFLALSLFTMIWYAAEDLHQTWIWYASLIALGALIIALFAVFEKKRQDILDLFERIKQWEG